MMALLRSVETRRWSLFEGYGSLRVCAGKIVLIPGPFLFLFISWMP
jgi:hypothetical protein